MKSKDEVTKLAEASINAAEDGDEAMTYQYSQFDAVYAEAHRRLTARIAAASSEDRRISAMHDLHSMRINYDYLRHMFATQPQDCLICKCCGTLATSTYDEPTKTQMHEGRLCFACNLWSRKGEHHPRGMVINGEVYSDGGRRNPRESFLGFGGREWKYRLIGDTDVRTTNNMWFGGTVPEEFIEMYPDTAEFVE